MPALAAITINDGLATPVAHTFNPAGPDKNGTNYLYDRSGGIAIGFGRVGLSLREPMPARNGTESKASRVYKAMVDVSIPVLESTSAATGTGIAPAPTIAYTTVVKMEFLLPERSTLQNRKDILAYAKNILSNSNVTHLVQDLEGFY